MDRKLWWAKFLIFLAQARGMEERKTRGKSSTSRKMLHFQQFFSAKRLCVQWCFWLGKKNFQMMVQNIRWNYVDVSFYFYQCGSEKKKIRLNFLTLNLSPIDVLNEIHAYWSLFTPETTTLWNNKKSIISKWRNYYVCGRKLDHKMWIFQRRRKLSFW